MTDKPESLFERAKKRIDDARGSATYTSQRARMLEDLKFSNPANPEQWAESAKRTRGDDRPTLVFDQTNQYIAQVVNDARQNKPGIKPLPVDSDGDIQVAEMLEGMIRHIEYVSRAGIAYDTAAEYAARIGLGYIRVVNRIMRPETNQQEICIQRIHDPLAVTLDPQSTEPDGSDAMWGSIESEIAKADFKREWPDAVVQDYDGQAQKWFGEDTVRICEYFEVVETDTRRKIVRGPDGETDDLSEDEYAEASAASGFEPMVEREYTATERKVIWAKMSGAAVLEKKEFPSQYLPIVPVIGYELWIEGKRYLCGMVRRMRDAQMAYNYERTAYIEAVALQPKAPFIGAAEALNGYMDHWANANKSGASILPYNHIDGEGNPLPMPQRQQPPVLPQAFVEGGQLALNDIQASIGMYQANLGAPSNETSGRAITARQREGDTANFHYQDNLNRSIEQLGRIIVDMIPRVYDTQRIARILGLDGKHQFVTINPDQPEPYRNDENGGISINPKVGVYDVRVVSGPSYTTIRQEASEGLSQILQRSPNLVPVLGPIWARMQDWPEADKVSQALMAMAPPEVQAVFGDDKEDKIPPHAMQMLQEAKQHFDGLMQQLQACQQELDAERQKNQQAEESQETEREKNQIEWYKAETARLAALKPEGVQPEAVAQIVVQLLSDMQQNVPQMVGPEPEYQPVSGAPEYEPITHEQQEIHLPQQPEPYPQPEPQDGSQYD